MKRFSAVLVVCSLVVLEIPAFAHHSFATEFDAKNCRDFTGTLTKIDWQSPHPYFYMDVKDANGKVESWSFQTLSIVTLQRAGTKRQTFIDNIGKEVFVKGCLARSGRERYAAGSTMKMSDGVLRQIGQIQGD